MPFDFHCRYGLFTYSQSSGVDHWSVLGHFTNLGAECIIAEEEHADGGTHLHVFADWGRRRRFRRADFADVDGFHPNISPSRGTPALGWDYATKDGNVVAGGLARPNDESGIHSKSQIWDIILDASSREQFFELARELAPGDLAKSFSSLQKYADWRYARVVAQYAGPARGDARFQTACYPGLDRWPNTPYLTIYEAESSTFQDSRIGLDASPISWSNNYTENQF
uniref:Replication-associated protein n=1 Tax=Muscicapa latirostris Genomoviridae sp. TaxID=2814967 RepID=A0A8E7G270_9VIRU